MIKMAVVDTALPQFKVEDYKEEIWNDWCAGCGDFGIVKGIQAALVNMQVPPHRVAILSGIGCSAKTVHYMNTYGFHTLHGRVLPSATGAKLGNHKMTVIAVGGDGDAYGIGAGYFLNTARRNLDLTYIVFDNAVYGLTKGQSSPTLRKGLKTKSMPEPAIQDGVNPIAIALGAGYTWIGRGYALDPAHLAKLIQSAIEHRGTALLDVLQTCPTYNDLYTVEWYAGKGKDPAPGKRLYKLEETGYDPLVHDSSNMDEVVAKKSQALTKSYEWGAHIPIGVFYQINAPTYEDALTERIPALNEYALSEMPLERDVAPLFKALT